MQVELGMRVQVKREQDRLGGPLYPGREGVVVDINEFGKSMNGGLWYVLLRKTKRAKERIELFAGGDLEQQDQSGHRYSAQFLEMVGIRKYMVKKYDQVTLEALMDELIKIESVDDFAVIPSIRRAVVMELARRQEYSLLPHPTSAT